VGPENFFLFGMTAEQVVALRGRGYRPEQVLAGDPELARVLRSIGEGRFSPGEPPLFDPLVRSLADRDPFFVLADFRAYVDCQRRVAQSWRDAEGWARTAILNVAAMGTFSSDRSIREYAQRVWKVPPVKVDAPASPEPPAP
jgi:starch phosphorylase